MGGNIKQSKMSTELVEAIKNFVEEESKKPGANYGYEAFICHFVPMVEHAKNLAKEEGVNLEIIELAAWLHDVGSIRYGRKDHHITGARIAEEKLKELNVSEEKIEKVKECIYSHRGSQNIHRVSKEAQIIADADALSAFDNISGLFKAAIYDENLTQVEAKKSVKEKLVNSWNKLSPKAKKFIQHKYLSAMILFE